MKEQLRAGPGVNSQSCLNFLPLHLEVGLSGEVEERCGGKLLGHEELSLGRKERNRERRKHGGGGLLISTCETGKF